jgi:hypothetical protein
MTRPRLHLTLPPLTPPEALALSYLCSTIDDLLWLHYGPEMVELLNRDPPAPGAWWAKRRDQFPLGIRRDPPAPRRRSQHHAPPALIIRDNEIEQGNAKERGR